MVATLARLAEISGGEIHQCDAPEHLSLADITLDSTECVEGAMFAALPGTRQHGAKFAAGTQASAILTDNEGVEILKSAGEQRPVLVVEDIRAVLGNVAAEIFEHPSKDLCIIGITGTSGKTTTSYLLEAGLLAEGKKVGLIGTTGTRINAKSVPTKLTTPEAPKLQALFRRMLDEGVTHVVMEVSSHALSLGRVTGTHFSAAGFTNLSQDHLDFHATMEEYFDAKALFFDPHSPVRAEKAVICIDDEWGVKMAEVAGSAGLTTVATTQDNQADVQASNVDIADNGSQRFQLAAQGEALTVDLPLPGAFNVANASLAIALAQVTGSDMDQFIAGIATVGVPGRMERVDEGQDFLAVVDYAHKPAAVAAVLKTLRGQVTGRVAVVVGAGGDRDAGKRPIMGAEAVRGADLVIVTDDNPRSEDPATIRKAVMEGALKAQAELTDREVEVKEIGDRREAIEAAIEWASTGDGIVVAGKGHEVGQLIGDVNHHFDDREEVREALTKRAEGIGETSS